MSDEDQISKSQKVSFFSKNKLKCPVCSEEFHREDLLTGRGRTIAGELGPDLRRFWETNPKYGKVIPILYSLSVCPNCFYSTYSHDFNELAKDGHTSKILMEKEGERKKVIEDLLGEITFYKSRDIISGIASYILAIMTYENAAPKFNPTFKNAMSSLRLAWLCDEANKEYPHQNYDYLSKVFYTKAAFLYGQVEEIEFSGKEPIEDITYFGPDSDVNYGYDGVIYLSVLLNYLFGSKENQELRIKSLEKGKRSLSRIVGLGKTSREKPSNIIEKARDLYFLVGKEIKQLEKGDNL